MTDDSLSDPPRLTTGDRAYQGAQVVLNAVPYAGGALAALMEVFGPPISRRQAAWAAEVAHAIRILHRQHVPLDSEEFVTGVYHASRIAVGTHLDAKLKMLKAAIIHCALPDRPADLVTIRFLRFVDELDPEHFTVLAYLRDPEGHFERHGLAKPNILMGGPGSIMDAARLPVTGETLPIVLADLGERRLADTASMNAIMTGNGAWAPRSTALGNQLLDFVTYIEPPDNVESTT